MRVQPIDDDRTSNDHDDESRAPEMLVLFRVGSLRLGLDVRRVREVARAVPLSALLSEAGGVAGMITLRGKSTAVVDLGVALGCAASQDADQARMIAVEYQGTAVCLLVDRIDGLLDVAASDLEPPPTVVARLDARWLDYVTRSKDGELIGILDVDQVLSRSSVGPMVVEAGGD